MLRVQPVRRDTAWRRSFFREVVDASFACGNPQFFVGPDGFPYLSLLTPEPNAPFEAQCLCNVSQHAVAQGFGATINNLGASVDWVFTCGDLLTLYLYDCLAVEDAPSPANLPSVEKISKGELVYVGQPADSYLPKATRSNIRTFLEKSAGIKNAGVYLMHRPKDNPPQQLVFSVFRDQFDSDERFRAVLQGIGWYLPRHYVVMALQSPRAGGGDFQPL